MLCIFTKFLCKQFEKKNEWIFTITIIYFRRVRKVTTDGRITLVAGREAECNCLDASCLCYDPDKFLASDVHFSAISALSVTPDKSSAPTGFVWTRQISTALAWISAFLHQESKALVRKYWIQDYLHIAAVVNVCTCVV